MAALQARWERERDLVAKVRELRGRLEALAAEPPSGNGGGAAEPLRAELAGLTRELAGLQGESPLVPVVVDGNLIGQVISGWTGIPVGKMLSDEVQVTLSLERHLETRVIGQSHAPKPSAAASARRAPGSKIPESPSACSCWSARAAWGRRRRHSRCPISSTGASVT